MPDAAARASACCSPARIRPAWRCPSRRFGARTRRCRCRVPAPSTSTWPSRSSKAAPRSRGCTPPSTATAGNWVSTEEIRRWAEKGIQTVHCHNDGDYYDDGLFWRDGSYPPYPDMDRYDKVLTDCRRAGIRTATYFSNKELHPSTKEFQEHGATWGRKNRKGDLQHNFFRAQQRVWRPDVPPVRLARVPEVSPSTGCSRTIRSTASTTTGTWPCSAAIRCTRPNPTRRAGPGPLGHRRIAGPDGVDPAARGAGGLVIVHNTTTPMFATENFADYVVATEWGYRKWTDRAPDLQDLPLEWSLAGARPRGVISYGTIEQEPPAAPPALRPGGIPGRRDPLAGQRGDLRACSPVETARRHRVVSVRRLAQPGGHLVGPPLCLGRLQPPGEAYLLLANLDQSPREVTCVLHPEKLPHPLAQPASRHPAACARRSVRPSGPAGRLPPGRSPVDR